MKSGSFLAASAFALALAGCGSPGGDLNAAANQAASQSAANSAPLNRIAAPNNGDWTQIVSRTPEGGYRMGNPNAPVRLVEYASLTCPHCAEFSEAATATLRDTYVRSGQVSWEFRNFVLNGPDMALSILARCQPDGGFFGTVEQIYAQQRQFLSAIDENEQRQLSALPPEQVIPPLARAMDLEAFFARRGMPAAGFNQCVSNQAAVQQLTEITNRAAAPGPMQITGTPTFVLNGEMLDVNAWPAIEQRLRAAIGG
ncbi:thioredoxin domain-containing protein [Sphingosinicella sp.]|uniref:thioredoxin domain-containing protein n=1 Tax=Sphingosinicella sp. TaxID=1917971 RepID=UPI00403820BF